jgi:hypothetical protein
LSLPASAPAPAPALPLQAIDSQQHNKDAHASLLEKEMGAALAELQALVQEGRQYIAKEVTKHKHLLDGNMKTLERRLTEVLALARARLAEQAGRGREEYEGAAALFCLLERVASAEAELVQVRDVRVCVCLCACVCRSLP